MSRPSELLSDSAQAGLHRLAGPLPVAELEAAAVRQGWLCVRLDGSGVASKPQFLARAAEALRFPAYFGHNWDAFEECLTDLSWLPATGWVVLFDHAEGLARAAPTDFSRALEILKAAGEFWRLQGKPFYVFVSGAFSTGSRRTRH